MLAPKRFGLKAAPNTAKTDTTAEIASFALFGAV
jgi:hypothetical protein